MIIFSFVYRPSYHYSSVIFNDLPNFTYALLCITIAYIVLMFICFVSLFLLTLRSILCSDWTSPRVKLYGVNPRLTTQSPYQNCTGHLYTILLHIQHPVWCSPDIYVKQISLLIIFMCYVIPQCTCLYD